jgi:hypothetical protein
MVGSFVPPSPVSLTIILSAAAAVISWTTNVQAGAILQQSSNLIHWADTLFPVVVQGASNTVTVAPQNQAQFYRLIH